MSPKKPIIILMIRKKTINRILRRRRGKRIKIKKVRIIRRTEIIRVKITGINVTPNSSISNNCCLRQLAANIIISVRVGGHRQRTAH